MMKKRNMRSYMFSFMMFAFVCLLLSGGSRLIGCDVQSPETEPLAAVRLVPAMLCQAPSTRAQEGAGCPRMYTPDRQTAVPVVVYRQPEITVLSDANGNVIGHRSYMHEVYQAFALGDGFV